MTTPNRRAEPVFEQEQQTTDELTKLLSANQNTRNGRFEESGGTHYSDSGMSDMLGFNSCPEGNMVVLGIGPLKIWPIKQHPILKSSEEKEY